MVTSYTVEGDGRTLCSAVARLPVLAASQPVDQRDDRHAKRDANQDSESVFHRQAPIIHSAINVIEPSSHQT